ncbi:hypothetical protein PFLA_b0350 [Pseudoalteromonas flavipulchra NCIMB 2033 = ATCC BAA-314]|nr:hypothetical protein [Pseudoalteromonas flavipulchra NCIMB 2033 = ATCC BAA-314]
MSKYSKNAIFPQYLRIYNLDAVETWALALFVNFSFLD